MVGAAVDVAAAVVVEGAAVVVVGAAVDVAATVDSVAAAEVRGLCRGAARNPRVPRLLPETLGNFPGCL